jgi:hypothetical protein
MLENKFIASELNYENAVIPYSITGFELILSEFRAVVTVQISQDGTDR